MTERRKILPLLIIVFLLLVLPFVILLARQRQEIRKKASGELPVGNLLVEPKTVTVEQTVYIYIVGTGSEQYGLIQGKVNYDQNYFQPTSPYSVWTPIGSAKSFLANGTSFIFGATSKTALLTGQMLVLSLRARQVSNGTNISLGAMDSNRPAKGVTLQNQASIFGSGASGINVVINGVATPTPTPTPVTFSCLRCSNNYGCRKSRFDSYNADCSTVIMSSVTYRLDCSCPQIQAGDNSWCAQCQMPMPTTAPTPIPTVAPKISAPPLSIDRTSPSVTITNPLNGSFATRNKVLNITASASDNVGVSRVLFYTNNTLRCTDTSSPYSCGWRVPSTRNATYNIMVKAYDAAGNSNSASVSVVGK